MGEWDGAAAWARGLGSLREVVRQEVVGRQLAAALTPPGRVLDVGCGQGTQALRLARVGHHVTGLDVSTDLLDRFSETLAAEPAQVRERVTLVHGSGTDGRDLVGSGFDAVLCHGVLMYLDDIAPLLQALSDAAAPRAVISLVVRNGLAPAMRDGLRGDFPAALAAFDSRDYVNRLGLAAHAHVPADTDAVLGPLGWEPARWYGVRVFTDHLDGSPSMNPDEFDTLLAAEERAGATDPYRQVAALLHLVHRRS